VRDDFFDFSSETEDANASHSDSDPDRGPRSRRNTLDLTSRAESRTGRSNSVSSSVAMASKNHHREHYILVPIDHGYTLPESLVINDAAEGIRAIRLPQLDFKASSPQGQGNPVKRAQIGIHTEIEIVRKPNVAMRCQGDRSDHQRVDALRGENGADFFSGRDDAIGVGHGLGLAGRWAKLRESRGHSQGCLDPLLDRHPAHPLDLRLQRSRMAGTRPPARK
jgi:hypothetical protein